MSIAQTIADAWVETMKGRDLFATDLDFWTRKPEPVSPEEQARREAERAAFGAEMAVATNKRRAKFLGTIVAVEDGDGDVLVYADGRRLRIISEWYEWEEPKEQE